MADETGGYSVGNLKIAFTALDKTSDDFKALEKNLRSIVNLINGISTADLGGFSANVKELTRAFNPFLTQVEKSTQGLQAFNDVARQIGINNISGVARELDEMGQTAGSVSELNGEIRETGSAAASGARQLNNLADAENNADKGAKKAKGSLSKLTKHIGGIALYRTIRRGLQMITRTFSESVQSYAMVDDNINKTMSQLTSSTKVIRLSLGTMLLPIIQAITPAVQQLSYGFANMANSINKTMALMNNSATYTRINVEAYEDYRKQIEKTSDALFDFDKFRALSSKQQDNLSASSFLTTETVSDLTEAEKKYSGIYTLVSGIGGALNTAFDIIDKIAKSSAIQTISTIVGGAVSGLSTAAGWLTDILDTTGLLEPILGGIAGYFTYIGASKLFIALGGGKFIKWIGAVVDLLKYDTCGTLKMLAGNITKVMSSTKMLAISFGALTTSIGYLVQNWDKMSTTGKTLTLVISSITAMAVGLFTAFVALKWAGLGVGAAIKAGLSAAALTASIGIAIGTAVSTSKSNIPTYANGGLPDKGTLFVAGEAGAEMVYNMPSGQSGVANIQQIYQAMRLGVLDALKEYGVARGDDIPQLKRADDTGIYQAAERGARKAGKTFRNV